MKNFDARRKEEDSGDNFEAEPREKLISVVEWDPSSKKVGLEAFGWQMKKS